MSRRAATCSRLPRSRWSFAEIPVAANRSIRPSVTTRVPVGVSASLPTVPVSRVLTPQSSPSATVWPALGTLGAGMRQGRSTRTRPSTRRKVGTQRLAQAGTCSGRASWIACHAHPVGEVGRPVRGSCTRSTAACVPVRWMVTSCLSAAASGITPLVRGGASSSVRQAGSGPSWSVVKARTCRVRMRSSALPTPCGSRPRSAAHSASVRRQGSAGQLPRIAWTTARRCTAERSARAAASSATRRTRSEAYTPSGAAAAQPSRRSAIHPLAGSARPSGPTPNSKVARAGSVQRVATTRVLIAWMSAARKPTRSASSRAGASSPVVSSTARRAVQVAVAVSATTEYLRNKHRPHATVATRVRILAPGTDNQPVPSIGPLRPAAQPRRGRLTIA